MNDKHSANPRVYPCKYCPYKSKRESNCKQHMEKSHGWVYERSKSSNASVGKRPATGYRPDEHFDQISQAESQSHTLSVYGQEQLSLPQAQHQAHHQPQLRHLRHVSHQVPIQPSFDDQVLFPHDGLDEPGVSKQGDSNQPIVTWESPATKHKGHENLIGNMPNLFPSPTSTSYLLQSSAGESSRGIGSASAGHFDAASHTNPQYAHLASGTPAYFPPSSVVSYPSLLPARTASFDSMSLVSDFAKIATGFSKRSYQDLSGSGSEDHRQSKKGKPNPTDAFSDDDMPDIFRYAHPDLYGIDTKGKSSACHTTHKNISTLV
jgi:uncharacterized C2H2 Zn-finger protein